MKRENNNYKYIHFFPYEKFTSSFVNFINENYNSKDHCFIIFGNIDYVKLDIHESKNIYYFKSTKQLIKANLSEIIDLKKADKLFAHSMFMSMELILLKYIKYINKINIIFWGGDIQDIKKKNIDLKSSILKKIKKYIISNASCIITLVPNDYKEISNIIKIKGCNKIGKYPMDQEQHKIISDLTSIKNDNPYCILVGNSATKSNCHLEIFDMLKRFKDENILIYCPLSYGDKQYREKVIKIGKKYFGNKFFPLIDYLEYSKYVKLIANSSVAIFNNNRQQALGNINASLELKTKVYMKKNTSMWDDYFNNKNFIIYDVQDIEKSTFHEFINMDCEIAIHNKKQIQYYGSTEYCIQVWNNLLK